MKKLIINADDFGYTPGVSLGIIEAHNKGIVTSTTALTVSDHFLEGMRLASQLAPGLGIGIHLTLTLNKAKPILRKEEVPSLVDEEGYFWNQSVYLEKVRPEEVRLEWEAQILRFLESGRKPDHLDSHHYVHGKVEELFNVTLELAEKYRLPIRNCSNEETFVSYRSRNDDYQTTDWTFLDFYGKAATLEVLERLFDEAVKSDKEIFEIGCHPAFIDPYLPELSSYCMERISELKILTLPEVKQMLKKRGILLTNYNIFY
ncbi:carbohydrate deacetylase [Enterococcus sp. BWT-B8]|uniref:carbohydrate deacetylase n=1 Tax=unclassified Enterococcus TaxID=2608891 RepID=UPI001E55CE15|nr:MULTISPECIES: carbohydrate deacetylase [unclassified Enterococcus]MCB5952842.1 carbohydrate deacetylase [Enterococcus sp. BWT-B8]MCB5953847.1 carbohydrate deacetylase [Enterococcus sp. CWB-B31]